MQTGQVDERAVLEHFKEKTRKSAQLFRKAATVTPGGVMAGIKYFEPYPIFMKRARGSRVWDVDGNEYVDYLMSYGAIVLGHGHAVVREAIESALASVGTTVTGTPTVAEVEYGATLRDLYHPDGLMRFTNSGLEATLLATRIARGHTGRTKIAKFEGHYHGAVDRLLFSYAPTVGGAGSAEAPVPIGDTIDVGDGILNDALVLPFNDWPSTERLLSRESRKLACVIMEPFEEGVIAGERRFMENLRRYTADVGIPLIYDEVKTGFRVAFGGAGEHYGITPDLTCLGKIIGGGLPIGAVVGDSKIMGLLEPSGDRRTRVFHSGTFNGNPLSILVGMATVEELGRPGRFDALRSRTRKLKEKLSETLREHHVSHTVEGEGGMFNLYLTDKKVRNYRDVKRSDLKLRRLLDLELISRGVYLKPENRFCLSLAHTDDDINLTQARFEGALDSVFASGRHPR